MCRDVGRRVVDRARALLRDGGTVAGEHADGHGQQVVDLLARNGFGEVRDHDDLAGRPRHATGRRTC